jgi:hypothetical protein
VTARRLTVDEVLALPVTVDLPTAGRAFGLGRTKSYEYARTGEFPCKVLTLGSRFVVTRRSILAALGIDETAAVGPGQSAELESRPALDALAEVLDAIPDAIARHAAYILLARLIELGTAGGTS